MVLYLLGVVSWAPRRYQFQVFPAPLLHHAFFGVNAFYERYVRNPAHGRYHPDIWQKAHRAETGVAADKRIVWEYLSPHRGGRKSELVAVTAAGQRFARDQLQFLPGAPGDAAAGAE